MPDGTDISNLTIAEQVAYAHQNTESLDTHSGYSTDALRDLSLDTSWLDDEGGNATEPPHLWYARIGRYILTCNDQGLYVSMEFDSPDLAHAGFEKLEQETS